jgi:hypothetical protein
MQWEEQQQAKDIVLVVIDEDPIARNIFPLSLPTSLPLPCYCHHLLSLAVMMRRRKAEDEERSICVVQREMLYVDLNVTVDITPIQSIAIVADARMLIVILE